MDDSHIKEGPGKVVPPESPGARVETCFFGDTRLAREFFAVSRLEAVAQAQRQRACLKVSQSGTTSSARLGVASGQTSVQADRRLWFPALSLITEPDFFPPFR